MPVGGGFARFSRMPPPRKEGDAVESVKETPVSQKDDSKVDSDMQQSWTDSIVDEAPNEKRFDDFGDDFGLPMDNLGGGMDFDNNADESLMGAWGETEAPPIMETNADALTETNSEERPASGISLFKRQASTAVSLGSSMMMNPPAVTTPKASRASIVLPVGTAPHAGAREVTPHGPGKDTSNHPGVSRPNSDRHNVLKHVTNFQLAEKLAPGDSGAAQSAVAHVNKTPPPLSNFVSPAVMATHKTIPSKTPTKTSRPIAASIQVTAEKERVVPFSSTTVSPFPPEKPVLTRQDYIGVSAGATASTGKEASVLAKEHDSESFEQVHEAFLSEIRDFGYKEKSYSQGLLDMNLILGISHADCMRSQADALDLTECMETMSFDIDDFLRDCMKE